MRKKKKKEILNHNNSHKASLSPSLSPRTSWQINFIISQRRKREKCYERALLFIYTHNIPLFIMAIIIIQQQHLSWVLSPLLIVFFSFICSHTRKCLFFILLLISFCLSPFNNRTRSDFFSLIRHEVFFLFFFIIFFIV